MDAVHFPNADIYNSQKNRVLTRKYKKGNRMEDKYNLNRFIKEHENTFSRAYEELSHGRKQSHWMWWIFPQITGLGT